MSSNGQHTINRKAVGSGGPPTSPKQKSPTEKPHQPPGSNGGKNWRAYTTMVASLLCGILLAIGHHLFYNSLNGKPVGAPEHVLRGVTRQQLNLTLGTLFSFLVRAFLAAAVTIAYTQVVWRAVKERSTTLSTIDTIFHVATNIWSFLSLSVWWKYPVLLLLALTIWLIPIASIITPAALNVVIAPTNPVPWRMSNVPNVDFNSLNFANTLTGRGVYFNYAGPKYAVDRVVAATAAQGSILPIKPPASNSSWVLDFPGPSITCTDVQGPFMDAIRENILAAVVSDNCETYFGYIGWTPTVHTQHGIEIHTMPFELSADNTSYALQGGSLGPLSSAAFAFPATFYAATFPNMTNKALSGPHCEHDITNMPGPLPEPTVIKCELYNTSYHASFSFENGEQNISITLDKTAQNLVFPFREIGVSQIRGYGPLANYTTDGKLVPNSYHTADVQTWAYQAVMESFGEVLVGTISNSVFSSGTIVTNDTDVMSTILGRTKELSWLNDYPPTIPGTRATLQQFLAATGTTPRSYWWDGVDVMDVVDDNRSAASLKDALESLFQNITVGLMSSNLLQPNTSSPYAPPPTKVTLPQYQTVYVYSPFKLWLAYGLAVLFATMGVLIGLSAMLLNGVTYTSNFSTILRTGRHAHMDTPILLEDADGKEPLPRYLMEATVSFSDDHLALQTRRMSRIEDVEGQGVNGRL